MCPIPVLRVYCFRMKLFLWISLLFAGLLVRDCESFRLSRAWPWQAKVQRTTETDVSIEPSAFLSCRDKLNLLKNKLSYLLSFMFLSNVQNYILREFGDSWELQRTNSNWVNMTYLIKGIFPVCLFCQILTSEAYRVAL